jgi:hypothetical protein
MPNKSIFLTVRNRTSCGGNYNPARMNVDFLAAEATEMFRVYKN